MSRKGKQASMPVGFAVAFGMALEDARTVRLRLKTEALRQAGATSAQIARAWRGDFTAADHAEADEWWREWLPEAKAEIAAPSRKTAAKALALPASAQDYARPSRSLCERRAAA